MAKHSSSDDVKKSSKSNGHLSVRVDGKTLVISIPLQKAKASASGKTMVVASTRGNKETEAKIDGQNVIVGVNAYYYAD